MPTEYILQSVNNHVLTLQFNRSDKKNAITAEMYDGLAEGLELAHKDDDIRCVKIIGDATSFCAGNDLSDFLENPPSDRNSPVWRFLKAISVCDKPLIAGVNGPAVGVGATLLLHCDLVVASESAVFALPFTSLGLCPEAGSTFLLPLLCGSKKAAEWLLLGDRFSSSDALQAGFINCSVSSAEDVEAQLEKWAAKLVRLPNGALQITRRLLRESQQELVVQQIKTEGDHFIELLDSDDAKAAFRKFLEK